MGLKAVAFHFLFAQLLDDGGGDEFGDDVELALLQLVVDDEAHEGRAVHGESHFLGLGAQVGFGFPGKRGVVPEKTLVVVGVDQDGVEGRREFLAGAYHLFAAHLLFGLLRDLDGADGGIEELIAHPFEAVFHTAFELREKPHVVLLSLLP